MIINSEIQNLIDRGVLFARYVATEKRLGVTMMMPRGGVKQGLEEITGIKAVA
jgi:hypothetical protein